MYFIVIIDPGMNYIPFNREELELLGGATVSIVSVSEFCMKTTDFLIFPELRSFKDSVAKCKEVGYEVPAGQ